MTSSPKGSNKRGKTSANTNRTPARYKKSRSNVLRVMAILMAVLMVIGIIAAAVNSIGM